MVRRTNKLDVNIAGNVYAYALASSTIDLCLRLFDWAPFRSTKAAIKLHTLLDLRGAIPSFIHISEGKRGDANVLEQLYKNRWQGELFFKWGKQNLEIKEFRNTSENAVKAQIWCAVATYVFIAIVKNQLHLDASL